jgi:isopentenyl diphosphate isomerase/L-lactate dehydrogenase-like FMN-dependent dehydrogenase
VTSMLGLLRAEFELALALAGCASTTAITRQLIVKRDPA